jgi:hypothetical protein
LYVHVHTYTCTKTYIHSLLHSLHTSRLNTRRSFLSLKIARARARAHTHIHTHTHIHAHNTIFTPDVCSTFTPPPKNPKEQEKCVKEQSRKTSITSSCLCLCLFPSHPTPSPCTPPSPSFAPGDLRERPPTFRQPF